MRKYLFIVLFLMSEFSFSQMIVPDTSKMSETDKMIWYQNEKKSPAAAIFYSWLLPTAGHAYAGNWKKGIMFKGAEMVTIIGGFTLIEASRDISILGISMVLSSPIIFIWEFYDVAKMTTLYNKQLYKNLFGEKSGITNSLIPKPKDIKLALSYNF